jgi:glycosyltransferase involved in cell wall biosynthesis
MKFWVTTPSYNQLDWLRLCVASVADQATDGVEVHHHVQDACSTDGTAEFLQEYATRHSSPATPAYTFSYSSERDAGMYDAINRGWEKSQGESDVLCHLNCDEQYLKNGLKKVADTFCAEPSADVVFATLLILDENGEYICHRRGLKPLKWLVPFVGPCPTASTFQRSDVFFEKGARFNLEWKTAGDLVWYNDLLKLDLRYAFCGCSTSIYTALESNLSNSEKGKAESRRYNSTFLKGFSFFKLVAEKINLIRRMAHDLVQANPLAYAIYRPDIPCRVEYKISKPSSIWGR